MSDYVVKLPDVGEGIAEAEIVEWHVAAGDTITEDQVMVEVMTDKATVELPSPVSGVVTELGGAIGDILAVGSALIRIDTSGNGAARPAADASAPEPELEPAPEPAPAPATSEELVPAEPVETQPVDREQVATVAPSLPPPPSPNGRVRPTAAPAVRQRAAALDIDIAGIAGSGPEGRVVHADLDAQLTRSRPAQAAVARPAPEAPGDDTFEEVPVVGLRRNIAQRMEIAKTRIPHFTYVDEIDVTEAERLRAELNEQHADDRPRLTLMPFLMRAVVVAVRDYPQMNARYDDDNGVIRRHAMIHLGVATQTPKGLMVPVVKNAAALDLWESAAEVSRLSTAARSNKITIEELSGSTITITSLGALGGIVSTPIINYPEVAIIGVNKIATRAVYADGAFQPRQIMNLSSSFDHRVVDGADAAAFIQRIKQLLETPALLFLP